MKLLISDLISSWKFTEGGIYNLIIDEDVTKSYNYLLNDLKLFKR
jgi:hypothetical protein